MDKYDVNFKRLALLLLPTFWRRPLFAAMAYAAVSPLQYLHTRFILWKRERLPPRTQRPGVLPAGAAERQVRSHRPEDHNHRNGRKRGLHHPAQTRGGRRGAGPAPRIGPDPDSQPPRLRRGERLRLLGEYPLALYDKLDITQVRAVVDAYKLASKRFSINYI